MPLSGSAVHQQLMDQHARLQSDLETESGEDSQEHQRRDEIRADRDEQLARLAEHYLPELTPEAIRHSWGEIRDSVAQILNRKQQHAARLNQAIASLMSQRSDHDRQLSSINTRLDDAIADQHAVATRVEQRLRQDDAFVELTDRAAMAEAALERAEANLNEIGQDSARKLPAYEKSALFRYLRDRGFGSPQYTSRGLTRRIDRWLARMIDFRKSKQSYDFLRKTPDQMRQIISEDRAALDTVMEELERRRDEAAASLGLPERVEVVATLKRQREKEIGVIDQLLDDVDKSRDELRAFDDPRGNYYREAIDRFRGLLRRQDSRDLQQRARQTIEWTDDEIVERLMTFEEEVEQLDDEGRQRRRRRRQSQTFLQDFGKLIQRFRAAEFDSSRSQFVDSLDLDQAVERAREAGDIDLVWNRLRDAQRWGPTAADRITAVATHPLTQVLLNAMAHAAGGALEAHARRAGKRRYDRHSRSQWRWPSSGSWDWDSSLWR